MLESALRPLGIHEEMFWRLDQAMPLNLTFSVKLKGDINEKLVRRGLDNVQKRHPLLGVCIKTAKGVPYFVSSEQPIPLTVQLGDDDSVNTIIDHYTNDVIDTETGPLVRCSLVSFGNDTHVIMFGYHHAVTDGRSMVLVFRDFLEAMGQSETDLNKIQPETFSLPQAYEQGLPRSTKGILGYIKWNFVVFRLYWGILRSGLLLKFLPLQSAAPLEKRSMKTFHRLLNKENSQRLMALCKAKGLSVHSTLHAAFALSAAEQIGFKKAKPLFIGTIADVRADLKPAPSATTGLFASAMGSSHSIKPGSDLWTLAKQLQSQLRKDKKLNISHVLTKYQFLPLTRLARFLKASTFLKVLNGFDSIQPKSIPLSNLGVLSILENFTGPFEVLEAKGSVAVSILGNISGGAFTLNDQIYTFVGACLPLVSEETAKSYHDRAIAIIEEAVQA